MTRLLTKAFEEASRLSEEAQDEIAKGFSRRSKARTTGTRPWRRTRTLWRRLADKALEDFKAGRTRKLGFDEL